MTDPFAHLMGDGTNGSHEIGRRMAEHCAEVDAANCVATYAYILPHCLNWLETHDYDVLLTWRSESPGHEGEIDCADLMRWNAVDIWHTPYIPPHAPGYGYPVVTVLWDTVKDCAAQAIA